MKKLLSAASLIALALSAGSALAADLPYRKDAPVYVPPPPPPLTWTGVYAGANIGGGWAPVPAIPIIGTSLALTAA